MKKLIKNFNHEIWTYCCNKWFDKRDEDFCPICKNK